MEEFSDIVFLFSQIEAIGVIWFCKAVRWKTGRLRDIHIYGWIQKQLLVFLSHERTPRWAAAASSSFRFICLLVEGRRPLCGSSFSFFSVFFCGEPRGRSFFHAEVSSCLHFRRTLETLASRCTWAEHILSMSAEFNRFFFPSFKRVFKRIRSGLVAFRSVKLPFFFENSEERGLDWTLSFFFVWILLFYRVNRDRRGALFLWK